MTRSATGHWLRRRTGHGAETLLAGVALIGLMAQPALAPSQDTTGQHQQQPAQAEQQQLAQDDIEFATKAAQGNLKEVRFGELAQQQAARDEVKQFAQRMVEDHGKANDQLKQIAQDKGVELPQELSDEDQQKYDELQQKSGEEFDQAYMDEMVRDHQEDIEEFEQYVETGQDPDLTSFAEQTLPVLKEHLQLAQETQKQISAAVDQGEQPATETEQPAAAAAGTQPAQQAATEAEQPAAAESQQLISLEKVLGSRVVNAKGDEVAKIEDLVVDENQIRYAVLSVGGFLGIGDKKVAVPFNELQLGENEAYLMSATTEQQLDQMPEYDEGQYQPLQQRG
jgi:putative membrane protein